MLVDLAIGVGGFVLVMCILYLFGYYAAPKMFGPDSSFEFSLVERILAGVLVALTILGLCLCLFALSFLGSLLKVLIIGG